MMGQRIARVALICCVAFTGLTLRSTASASSDAYPLELEVAASSAGDPLVATIRGRALESGAAAAGLDVRITRSGPDGTRTVASLQTDADGAFTTTDEPSIRGNYTYRALAGSGSSATLAQVSLTGLGSTAPPVRLPVPPPRGNATVHLDGYRQFIVDDDAGLIFVSTGLASTIEVLDLDGHFVRSIPVTTPSGIALSVDGTTLFVGLDYYAAAVAVIDVATLDVVGRLPLTAHGYWSIYHVFDVLDAGGRLAYMYTGEGDIGGVSLLDLSHPAAQTTEDDWYWASRFVPRPGDPGHPMMFTFSSFAYSELNLTGDVPAVGEPRTYPQGDAEDFHFAPDGKSLFLAGATQGYPGLRVDEAGNILTVYPTGASPTAIVSTQDERFVAIGKESYGTPLRLWDASGTVALRDYDDRDSVGPEIEAHGLAFNSDATRLYAVSKQMLANFYDGDATFTVLADPLAPCALTVQVDPMAGNATSATIEGTLHAVDHSPIANVPVLVNVSIDGGTHQSSGVLTGADGTFRFTEALGAESEHVEADAVATPLQGLSACHATSIADRPPTRPSPPAAVYASALGNGSLWAYWRPPPFDGRSPITGYSTIILRSGKFVRWIVLSPRSWYQVANGLSAGTYDVYVVASNAVGHSGLPPPVHARVI